MEIEGIRVFDAPNVYSLREPIVRLCVKLGELADVPTKDIGNINDKIIKLFPGIKNHKCSTGVVGEFVKRLIEGTCLAHVIMHLSLETQWILGYDIKYGTERQVEKDVFYVIFACVHPIIGKACGTFVVDTINALVAGQIVEIDRELSKLKNMCTEYEIGINTGKIMSESERREITIPIVSITGTNGKTTTTRMISSILMHHGLTVGTTTSQGIYINDRCIEHGDTTGPNSAKKILCSREIEAAVLETARGGIVRRGLAYEKADVAVFTNLTRDHIGMDGIHTMEELLHAKSLVIEAVKDSGVCVLNADDPWVMRIREKAKGKQILFSINDNNPILQEHIKNGGISVYRRNNGVCINIKGALQTISLSDIPATLNGKLSHNIYNCMAAIGACLALGIPFENIEGALIKFGCDVNSNPGRFNIYDLGKIKVIVDFGHNIDGYRVTINGLKALNPLRLIGIIRAPGDRPNVDILSIGEISGRSFDHIIIREDKDLRGRQPLEAAKLLYSGALSAGISKENTEIIPDEEQALKKALDNAQDGDVISIFFEKMEPLIKIIMEYKNSFYKDYKL